MPCCVIVNRSLLPADDAKPFCESVIDFYAIMISFPRFYPQQMRWLYLESPDVDTGILVDVKGQVVSSVIMMTISFSYHGGCLFIDHVWLGCLTLHQGQRTES